MKYISICSGIEAASVGWESLGWQPVGFAEIDKYPSAVLAHHFPDVPNFGDFTKITKTDVGEFDLLVGGTPCQDFSVAGKRKGFEGSRGTLTYEYVRLLQRTMPEWFVWENVPGVLSGDLKRGFLEFVWELNQLGYVVQWRVLDAQYCRVDGFERAVPQRRRRVFVVGHLGKPSEQPILFEPQSLLGHTPPSRKTWSATTANVKNGINNSCTRGSHWDGCGVHPNLTQAGNCGGVGMSNQELFSQRGAYLVMASGAANAEIAENHSPTLTCSHDGSPIVLAGNIIGRQPKNGGNHTGFDDSGTCYTLTSADRHAVCFQQNSRDEVRLINGDGKNAGALTAEPGAKQQNYIMQSNSVIRRLTPVECERLQGFPDNWTRIPWNGKTAADCPDGHRYKALGNSMACNVMRWIGRRIENECGN